VNPYDITQVVIGYFSAGGTTKLGHANALAAATSNVEIYSGTLDLNGQTGVRAKNLLLYGGASSALVNDSTTTGASFAGGVTLANNATHVGGTGQLTLSGILSGSGGFTKTGTGTLTLSGVNTYSGATSVNAGTVVVNGSAASSAFTVNSGATLGGNGTIGALTIASGGILAPGNSPGTLTAGDTTFAGGGAFQFQLNNAIGSAGTNWDVLAVNGTLTLSATAGNPFTLDVTSLTLADAAGNAANFNAASDYSFTFLTTTGGVSGFSSDAFAIDTTHFTNPFTGTWSVSLTNSGHDLSVNYTASAVPEPSTWAALAGLAALGAAGLRRRRARRS
jgi:autotransporter-associated beta strand protein